MKYNITEQGDNFFINGIEIPNEIFDKEKQILKLFIEKILSMI